MLDDEFIQYCKLNNIEDVEKYAKQVFDRGFTVIKYGDKPQIKLPSKEEITRKWEESGLLDNLKSMVENKPVNDLVKPNTQQNIEATPVVKKETDLYDE